MKGAKEALNRIYIISRDTKVGSSWTLESLLHQINFQATIYVLCEGTQDQWASILEAAEVLERFLSRWSFFQVTLRPVHPLRAPVDSLYDIYRVLLEMGRQFHLEGWRHQVASRWGVHPVIWIKREKDVDQGLALAKFLGERLMVASFLLPPEALQWGRITDLGGGRLLIDERGTLEALVANDLLDEFEQGMRLRSPEKGLPRACSSLVIDLKRGMVQRCPWQRGFSLDGVNECLSVEEPDICWQCFKRLPWLLQTTLDINGEREQGDRLHHRVGLMAMSQGELKEALEHFSVVAGRCRLKELKGESLLYTGIVKMEMGRLEEAHEPLKGAHELLPHSSAASFYLARCEYGLGDFIAATDLLREALRLGVPDEMKDEINFMLSISHLQIEEYEEAMEALHGLDDQRPEVVFYRAMALLGMGRLEEALEGFTTVLSLGPLREDLPQVHFYRAYCLKELGRFEEAVEALEEALREDPSHYDSWNLKGYCLFRLMRHGQAVSAFKEAIKIRPESGIDHANIATNLREMGQLEDAVQWYQRALEMDPTLSWAASNLAKLRIKLDKKGRQDG
jgi:tetratricopeptide (TPR) repeat protein